MAESAGPSRESNVLVVIGGHPVEEERFLGTVDGLEGMN